MLNQKKMNSYVVYLIDKLTGQHINIGDGIVPVDSSKAYEQLLIFAARYKMPFHLDNRTVNNYLLANDTFKFAENDSHYLKVISRE